MPEITGAAWTGVWAACSWCGEPTDSWGDAPGLAGSPRIPIHVLCAADVVRAYGRPRLRDAEARGRFEARLLELRDGRA